MKDYDPNLLALFWLTWMLTTFMVSILNYFNFIQNFNFLTYFKIFILILYFYILGWPMSEHLPVDGFAWVEEELTDTDIMNKPKGDSTGLVLQVDQEIPEHLHDYFSDYVPAPEHVKITKHMLSPYNKECMKKLNVKLTAIKKLVPNLHNKEKYVVHYRTLQLYLQLGMKLGKVHRAMKLNQSPWLQKYIAFNIEQRKKAKNTFEKNFFKLMNNSVFERVRVLFFIIF